MVSDRACCGDGIKESGGHFRGFADQVMIGGDFFFSKVWEIPVVKVEGDDGVLDDFSGAARAVAFSGEGSKGIDSISWVRYGLTIATSGALMIGMAVFAGAARVPVRRRKVAKGKTVK